MNFYRLFTLGRAFLAVVLLLIGGCLIIIRITTQQIREELAYHARYSSDWVQQYESVHGSLVRANVKIALGIAYLMGLTMFLLWVYQRNRLNHSHRRRH